jgi:hypothetical protein
MVQSVGLGGSARRLPGLVFPGARRAARAAEGVVWMSDASVCHERGWVPGSIIEGDEGYGPERRVITAVGLTYVLATRGNPESECLLTLQYRDWKLVGFKPLSEFPNA